MNRATPEQQRHAKGSADMSAAVRLVPESAISDYRRKLDVEREKLRQAIIRRMARD